MNSCIDKIRQLGSSPVVLVQKKDRGILVDYCQLNQVTKLDKFPLPTVDNTLDLFAGSHFSSLDVVSRYWQVAMDPDSKERPCLLPSGLFQFLKILFFLIVNAPATLQRLMQIMLSRLTSCVCCVYMDDVLVFGRTMAEHNSNLTQVLEWLFRTGLRLKPGKCKFALPEVEYFGHACGDRKGCEHGLQEG